MQKNLFHVHNVVKLFHKKVHQSVIFQLTLINAMTVERHLLHSWSYKNISKSILLVNNVVRYFTERGILSVIVKPHALINATSVKRHLLHRWSYKNINKSILHVNYVVRYFLKNGAWSGTIKHMLLNADIVKNI